MRALALLTFTTSMSQIASAVDAAPVLGIGSLQLCPVQFKIAGPLVKAAHLIVDLAASSTSEGFDGKVVALFHLGLIARFDDGDGLFAVDGVRVDRMPSEVSDRFDCANFERPNVRSNRQPPGIH